ncbi:hypothetical protein MVEN_01785200 [Mycena venus]|uniref:Uncharacterized protein n=1 Tax=Mycena venus TaxID=2733690 RepID=A0A8H7CN22_9AGAR|nr:hypothetical protein MVEN_01785200 [Mycena venus]
MSTQSTTDGELTKRLLATAATFIQVFASLNPDTIAPIQAENYRQEFAPASANGPPPRSRDEFAAHLRHLGEILSGFPVRAKQTWPNPSLRQVVVWADSETQFYPQFKDNDDEEEWRYRGEYMFILTMDQTGEKIEHVLEFLDSKGTERLRGLMARARKMKEAVEGK